jgi:hypothetical protein
MESKTGGETPVTPEDASSDVVRLVLFASILIASPIALATTMLLFPSSWASGAQNGRVIFPGPLFGILIASIYLSKSSMIAVGIVMVIALSVVSRNFTSDIICGDSSAARDAVLGSTDSSRRGANFFRHESGWIQPAQREQSDLPRALPASIQYEYRSLLCRYWRRTSLQIRVGL